LREIEKLIKRDIPKQVLAGFEPDPTIKAEPIVLGRSMTIGRNNGGGNNGGARRPALGAKPKPKTAGNTASNGKPSGGKPQGATRRSKPKKPVIKIG
jgi:ATP-dependent RNA helicase RhlE